MAYLYLCPGSTPFAIAAGHWLRHHCLFFDHIPSILQHWQQFFSSLTWLDCYNLWEALQTYHLLYLWVPWILVDQPSHPRLHHRLFLCHTASVALYQFPFRFSLFYSLKTSRPSQWKQIPITYHSLSSLAFVFAGQPILLRSFWPKHSHSCFLVWLHVLFAFLLFVLSLKTWLLLELWLRLQIGCFYLQPRCRIGGPFWLTSLTFSSFLTLFWFCDFVLNYFF